MTTVVLVTGLLVVLVQLPEAVQVGSPPPLAVAVLLTLGAAAAVGVTGMVKLTVPPLAAKPVATVQVTTWPAAKQPAGMVPRVRLAGTVSLIVVAAVVAAVPLLVSVSV